MISDRSNELKYQIIKLGIRGEYKLRLPYDEDGTYCPVCAYPEGDFPCYDSSGCPSYEICPSCSIQSDDDVYPFHDWILSYDDYLMAYRINWLDKNGWTAERLARLKFVLEIEESDLRVCEDTLRAEWKRCWELMLERNKEKAIRLGWIPNPKLSKTDNNNPTQS